MQPLLILAALLVMITMMATPTPAEPSIPDIPWSKPDGGLRVDLQPLQEQVAAGTPLEVLLVVSADPGFTSVTTTLDSEGSLGLVEEPTSILRSLSRRGTATDRFTFRVGTTGEERVTVRVSGRNGNGQLVSRLDQFFVLADGDAVYTSVSGPLDLHISRLEDRFARGLIDERAYELTLDELLSGGTIETISVSEPRGSEATVNVIGHIAYLDSAGTPHAVPRARVDIFDEEPDGAELVTTTSTDLAGDFAVVVDNNDGPGEGGRDLYARVYARNLEVEIKSKDGKVHSMRSVVRELEDGTTLTITLTANNTDDNDTAFSVYHAMTVAMDYARRVNGGPFPFASVIFPTDRQTSLHDPNTGELHILQLDRFDWDVIHHEYGHFVMKRLNIEDTPGGKHGYENLGERLGKDAGIRLAWGEGWPTYFGTSLQQVRNTAVLGIPNVGDVRYQDTEDSTLNYSLETDGLEPGLGEDDEYTVQRTLWDAYDSADDAGDGGVAWGDLALWTTLDAANATTLSAAYAAMVNGMSVEEQVRLGCIFSEHGVAPEPILPADRTLIADQMPPKFEWTAQGGGPSNLNDKFFVEFYNADFSQLLFTSPELDTTNYTPPPLVWETILDDGDALINWVVRSRQSNTPETGPYLSCQHRLVRNQLDLLFVIDATASMSDDIVSVINSASAIVAEIAASGADYRIGIVTYKDFPADYCINDYPARIDLDFDTDADVITNALKAIVVDGGCDLPETVYSGLMTGLSMDWRPGVSKSIILMGDFPPKDPEPVTGYTQASVLAAANDLAIVLPRQTAASAETSAIESVTFYPIFIGTFPPTEVSFAALAEGTGGVMARAQHAGEIVDAIFEQLDTILHAPIAGAGGPYDADVGEPMIVSAANSYDIDGTIVSYEWDFDDDGAYDLTTDVASASYVYTAKYEGYLRLRVTDDDGLTGSANAFVKVAIAPLADAGGPYEADPGEAILFDASASSDADGTIVTYAWDFDNDGVVDVSGPDPTASFSFTGNYDGVAVLRISDDDGRIDTDVALVVVKEEYQLFLPVSVGSE